MLLCKWNDRVWRFQRTFWCLYHPPAWPVWQWVSNGVGWHFFGGAHTVLHVLTRSSLTAIRYQDEILRPLVRPYSGEVGPGFLLIQDNARPHVAWVARRRHWCYGLAHPTPDLNPIEHIWDVMFHSIRQHHVEPQTVQELADDLVQV